MLNNVLDTLFASTGSPTVESFLICLGVSLVLGVLTSICSMYKSPNRSKSLSVSLVLLPMIVQTIIMLVNGQLGAAIGVAGAFSLVRFRSAPASARDITSIFLAMAVGLANGMGYVAIAIILAIVVLSVDLILAKLGFGSSGTCERDLKIVIPESLNYDEEFESIFKKFTSKHELTKVKTTNMGSLYHVHYRVTLKDNKKEKEFIDEIRCRNGNLEIVCVKPDTGKLEI